MHPPDREQIVGFVADQFHRNGKIFKGRRSRIVPDHVYIGLNLVHRLLKRCRKIGYLDFIPWRHAVIGSGPGLKHAVLGRIGWCRLHRTHLVQFCCCHFFSMMVGQSGCRDRAEKRGAGHAQKKFAGG